MKETLTHSCKLIRLLTLAYGMTASLSLGIHTAWGESGATPPTHSDAMDAEAKSWSETKKAFNSFKLPEQWKTNRPSQQEYRTTW